jgi:hypothetical protein
MIGVDDASITEQIGDFEMSIKIGFIQTFFASIESSFRIICREVSPGRINNTAGEFKSVYDHLFSNKFNLPNHICLLDLLRLSRNTIHNNGIFYSKNQMDTVVEFKGIKYKFEVGKIPSFLTWELLLSLIADIKDMHVDVVNSPILRGITKTFSEV